VRVRAKAYAAAMHADVPQDVRDRISRLQAKLSELLVDTRPAV
jgi:hypothetical protein